MPETIRENSKRKQCAKKSITLCRVPLHNVNKKEATECIMDFAESSEQHHAVTVNPEFIIEAQKNIPFKNVLERASLAVADGVGILWGSTLIYGTKTPKLGIIKYLCLPFQLMLTLLYIIFRPKKIRKILKERVTGVDLFEEICKEAEKKKFGIFLLGAGEGVAEEARKKLYKKYPHLKVTGIHAGTPKGKDEAYIRKIINVAKPAILFVAYGSPAQELWIDRNLHHLATVRVAIGVGGTFDFIAGIRKRAPKWMQKIGLEWLWRLILEPRRIGRIINATVRFMWLVIKEKLRI